MSADQVELGSGGVIRRHEQVRLVFIGRIGGRRLGRRRQPLEIKLVGVAFAVHFAHDVLVVVITAKCKMDSKSTCVDQLGGGTISTLKSSGTLIKEDYQLVE